MERVANLVVGKAEGDLVYVSDLEYVADGHIDRVANLVVGKAEGDLVYVRDLE
jgi:hypothetical protein